MSRIFITGSADGLGKMAGEILLEQGHEVVFHARNKTRAEETKRAIKQGPQIVIGDLSRLAEMKSVAEQVNKLGHFDAVIHNAGVGYQEPRRDETEDNLPRVFAVNTMAPYVLTALIEMPRRLIYLSSGLHPNGDEGLDDLIWTKRKWAGTQAYSETKFHDVLLAFAMARRYPKVLANALEPGWVPTKMGGAGAPDDINLGHRTQAWLAVSEDKAALVSGEYFFHQKTHPVHPETRNESKQNSLIEQCEKISGIKLQA